MARLWIRHDPGEGQVSRDRIRASLDGMDLSAAAATQGGAFTTQQARAKGWTRWAISDAVSSGRWRRLTKGAFVEQALWAAMDPRAQHLCAVHAALLTRDPGWHAGRRSAAIAHGLPLLGRGPLLPQLVREPLRPTDRPLQLTT